MNLKQLNELIKTNQKIIIFRHINPDYDAYGSQFGLKYIIEENYPDKNVLTYGNESMRTSMEAVLDNPQKSSDSLCIALDIATAKRCDGADIFFKGKTTVKVDHHLNVDSYCENEYVDEHAGSCCEIICRFALENELRIPLKAANWLYTGMSTDTVRFSTNSVNANTFKILAMLADLGIDIPALNHMAYDDPIDVYRAQSYFRNQIVFKEDIAYLIVTKDMQKQFNLTDKECKDQVSLMRNIIGVDRYVSFFENGEDNYAVSLRSNSKSVVHICQQYGGGGHALACGADNIRKCDIDDIVELLLKVK